MYEKSVSARATNNFGTLAQASTTGGEIPGLKYHMADGFLELS